MFALMPFSRASFATDTPGSQAAAASRSRSSRGVVRPAHPEVPGFFSSDCDKVMPISSEMMGITSGVYLSHRLQRPARAALPCCHRS